MALIQALKNLPDDFWTFQNTDVHTYTHGIANYPATMVSPISRHIIGLVKQERPVDALLDPFCGSGTVLLEGQLARIGHIVGNDLNPLARLIAKVKTTLIPDGLLEEQTTTLLSAIDKDYLKQAGDYEYVENQLGLDYAAKDGWGKDAPVYLREYCEKTCIDLEIPDFANLGYWFKPYVILTLALIKKHILEIENKDYQDFAKVAFCETIRLMSNRRNGEFKLYRMAPESVRNFFPNVLATFDKILNENVAKLKTLPKNLSKVEIVADDSRELGDLIDGQYDLVITSPPYGDSKTTVAYGQFSRLQLQWLDFEDTNKIDKNLLGGKKNTSQISSQIARQAIATIREKDTKRADEVANFYGDLEKSIDTIAGKTSQGGYQFWVVGNRIVKGELLETDKIIMEIASRYGLQTLFSTKRRIVNKVMPSSNSPSNKVGEKSSTMLGETIIFLEKS